MSHPQDPPPTRLESDDEIRAAIEARRARLTGLTQPAAITPPIAPAPAPRPAAATTMPASPQPTTAPAPIPTAPPPSPDVTFERPVLRPPMALLFVADDGRPPQEGECFRLRHDATVIGRDEGDVMVPHDGLMSGRHAEIVRQHTANGWRWLLRDLGSRNGTYVRIGGSILRPGNEFMVGNGRYRFEAAAPLPAGGPAVSSQGTQGWDGPSVGALLPALVEVGPNGPGKRIPLRGECWIGRDAGCTIVRADDELVSPRHACVSRDARGEWQVRNNASINGVWLRIADALALGAACHFRLGEQKFLFKGTDR